MNKQKFKKVPNSAIQIKTLLELMLQLNMQCKIGTYVNICRAELENGSLELTISTRILNVAPREREE